MEHIAYTVGMDAMDVKINNLSSTTFPTFPQYWQTMQSWGDIASRKAACKTFNEVNIFQPYGFCYVHLFLKVVQELIQFIKANIHNLSASR